MSGQQQFGRKASLVVVRPGQRGNNPSAFVPESMLDLSEAHFTFRTEQQDVESPNNCSIRIYNLSNETVDTIVKNEYSRVVLQAGYTTSGYGVIFDGTIKQFRLGRENATDKFIDLLAADGDLAFNFSVVNKTLAAGSSPSDRVRAAIEAMQPLGVTQGYTMPFTGGVLPRGKVLFGMSRVVLSQVAHSQEATWNIENGQVQILPLDGYKPGEAVVLSALTGLVGLPEQTTDGLRARCLLNPRIVVGSVVQIDNKTINQIIQQNPDAAPVPFNQWTGIQNLATITSDGLYRVYVAEHTGDTRGQNWYTDLVCLAVNPVTKKVKAY